MSRMKEATATTTRATLFVPITPVPIDRLVNALGLNPISVPVRRVDLVNDVPVPKLRSSWQDRAQQIFPRLLSSVELDDLRAILTTYVRGRTAGTNPIYWQDFEESLVRFAKTSRALLDAFDDQSPGSDARMADDLANAPKPQPLRDWIETIFILSFQLFMGQACARLKALVHVGKTA